MNEFEKDMEIYLEEKRKRMREKYNRVLPTGELLFNRFDKAKYLNCGVGSSIYDTSIVMGDVKIGENVWVGPYTILEGTSAELIIDDFVSINAGVMVYTHDSTKYYVSGGISPFEKSGVHIHSNVVIGTMSTISAGVEIGKHSVVAAYSLVNKNVPEFAIVAGVPAKIIGKVILNDNGVDFVYNEKYNL